ncbi:uncharacterized protein LOC142223607 [Haematobia irritans]|uniref:uncharacterized protein LOC142223607 n=1 Tax=Haematobia irritans TaxID=7368 RepID=UPI003F50A456
MKQSANTGNMHKVCASINNIGYNNIRNTDIIKYSDGKVLTSPASQHSRWQEYYIEEQRILDNSTWQRQRLDISIKPPMTAEIETTLLQLKNGKSARPDNIPAELLPTNNRTKLHNQARLVLTRITPVVENILRKEYTGFRKGKSCSDHINILRVNIEQSRELNSLLYLLFVDFECALDTSAIEALWETLAEKCFPDKIIVLIRLYNASETVQRYRKPAFQLDGAA